MELEPSPTASHGHLNIVVVGHVDHGKSTLLGRLYADTGSLPEGKLEKIRAICRQQGKDFEYAFLFDAFLEEQQQGVTIDTARTFFSWKGRHYIIVDAPGHKEFLKNMISGAARADAALLVIDALEGVKEQSMRHGYLLSMLGVHQVAVLVNKMDLVGYRQDVFQAIEKEYREFLSHLNVVPSYVIPVSAKQGENIFRPSPRMPWFTGPSVLEGLGRFHAKTRPAKQALRFPIQDVYKFDARRILAGRITAGSLKVGDRLIFSPSNKSTSVKTIEAFNVEPPPVEAHAGQSVGITLDEQLFVERGEVLSHEENLPHASTVFRANVFWLGQRPLEARRPYVIRLATQEVLCEIVDIHRIVDATALDQRQTQATAVKKNEVAELTVRTRDPVAFDLYADFEVTGRFVLVDEYDVSGGGIITDLVHDEQEGLRHEAREREFAWVKGDVGAEERAQYYGHRAAIILLAGDRRTGKSFLARKLESLLVTEGRHAYLLDADNLRRGLDADLAHPTAAELIRRYSEVARLLADTGLIVISTTHPFGTAYPRAIESIRTLVHPVPVITVYMGKTVDELPSDRDIAFTGPVDFDEASHELVDVLKRKGILAHAIGTKSAFEFSI